MTHLDRSEELGAAEAGKKGVDRSMGLEASPSGVTETAGQKEEQTGTASGKSSPSSSPPAGEESPGFTPEKKQTEEALKGDSPADLSESEGCNERGSESDEDGDLKKKGLALFEKQDFEGAIDCWKRGLRAVNFVLSKDIDDPEKTKEFAQMKMSYLLNLSLGSLKAGQFGPCVHYCDDVLDTDPFHLKALFRKAQALHNLGRLEDSLAMVESLLEAHPNNPAALALEQKLKRELHAYRKKERQMARTMLEHIDADPRSAASATQAPDGETSGFLSRMKAALGFSKESARADFGRLQAAEGSRSSPPSFPFSPPFAFPPNASPDARQFGAGGQGNNPLASLFGSPPHFGAPGHPDAQRLSQDMRDLQRLMELNQRLMESGDDAGFFEKVRLAWAFCCFAGRALLQRTWDACKRRCRDSCSRRKLPPQPYYTVSPLRQAAGTPGSQEAPEAFQDRTGRGKPDNGFSSFAACAGRETGPQVPRFEEVDEGTGVCERTRSARETEAVVLPAGGDRKGGSEYTQTRRRRGHV
ncbi:CBR-FKB-6 protein, related [Neospora caninum Liverpool]|uniref:peptidylprolyl isomerase n=1 Tax=Neospora caninum (strain Liverpool) TaxID=572307 RepID=F0VE81_NEOCL|nr:CBR-FKB-6 protein, related [Neospora caninum Liverpool]CBZ52025.1 CBR-FKB-6 protein, related [Neospora caninum Liverpool]CEL65986.1 TPA: CBR-FKB-6 protein, related [Neospora caninum Liverpool]|eukprot:XP_003882057.1 CBR-FKB-6 protein, related [Neospora caninum Liverpool]